MAVLNSVWRLGLVHDPVTTQGSPSPKDQSGSDKTFPLCYSFVLHVYPKIVLKAGLAFRDKIGLAFRPL